MRKTAKSGAYVAAMIAAAVLGGCREIEQHFADLRLFHAEPLPSSTASLRRKSLAHRIAKPTPVAAGHRIRQFCGQRHIRFQTGHLDETAQEKARNDVLCSQA